MERTAPASAYGAAMRQRQFSSLLKLAPQAILVLDADGRIREWNPAAVEMLGWTRDEVLERSLPELAPVAHRAELLNLWTELQATGLAGSVQTRHLHRGGADVPAEVYMAPIQDVDGSFAGVVATLTREGHQPPPPAADALSTDLAPDLPEQAVPSEPMAAASELDDVTGLHGRRWLQQRLTTALAPGAERAVAVLDVDAFALVNQGYGPEAGDAVLRELAARLAQVCGSAALGRWQADEFVCILEGSDAAEALESLIAEMAQATRQPFALAEDLVRLTVSVGLACSSAVPVARLFRSASAAMAAAKARGRDCAVWFDEAKTPEVGGSGLRMANDLHRGLTQDEMRLHFQPILDLATNEVDGVEALIRWERPGVGLLTPDAFIEIAERTGQIVALGEWVFGQACRAAVDFEVAKLSPVRVSVNVSARQLSDPGLASILSAALAGSGCPPERIAIEVTETAVLHDLGAAAAVLESIKSLGVELDLDDFGTGYSSLLYLRHFPVDRIKIDRSFVSGLGTSIADTAIVASTIALAHSVGLRAMAEGVETAQQLTLLRQMGCDFAQGYLLSYPLPAEQLVPWLQQQLHTRLVPRQSGSSTGGDPTSRDSAANQRDHLSDQRDDVADQRDHAGDKRDIAGQHRDTAGDHRDVDADQRDRAGDLRDRKGDQRDAIADHRDLLADERDAEASRRERATFAQRAHDGDAEAREDAGREEALQVSAADRHRAAVHRHLASEDRVVGAGDRLQAHSDRQHARVGRGASADERLRAGHDRTHALENRQSSAQGRQKASFDALTGAYLRAPGLAMIAAELDTAINGHEPLTLARVAVKRHTGTAQAEGQIDADALMVIVANALGARLGEADLLVRTGTRQFLCALRGQSVEAVAERMASLDAELVGPPRLGGVRVGYAERQADEPLERLIERARPPR